MQTRFTSILFTLAIVAMPASAEPVSLKFAFPAPPQSQVLTWGIAPWIEEVHKAANGALDIKVFPGPALGNFTNIYDRTINGVTELSFGVFGPMSGEFQRTSVSEMPFEADNDVQASVALWRLYDKRVISDEYGKVKPLALFTFPASGVHTSKEIKSTADLKGVKVAVFGRSASEEAELLNATPITMTPSDAYQSVQRGLVSAVLVGWSAVLPFKLQEVTTYHLETSLGQAPAFVFMNKDAYAKLPDEAKRAIDKLSYEGFSRRMGDVTDRQDDLGRTTVGKIPGHKIYNLPPDQVPIWKAALAPMTETWIKATPNGTAILAAWREELKKLRGAK